MNLDFIKKLVVGLAEGALKNELVEIIQKAETRNPVAVKALEDAFIGLLPLLHQIASETSTKVDDHVVDFLDDLMQDLQPPVHANDGGDEPALPTDPDEHHGGDPSNP